MMVQFSDVLIFLFLFVCFYKHKEAINTCLNRDETKTESAAIEQKKEANHFWDSLIE
jgi:hypothetical protein